MKEAAVPIPGVWGVPPELPWLLVGAEGTPPVPITVARFEELEIFLRLDTLVDDVEDWLAPRAITLVVVAEVLGSL